MGEPKNQTNKQKKNTEKQRKGDAIQCSTHPTMMGGKPGNYYPQAYSEPVKSLLTFTKKIYIPASAKGAGNMDIYYSTGHWEGNPCFPSLPQALPSSELVATPQMGEEGGSAAAWLVFGIVHQGGTVTALESCSYILLWAKATLSSSTCSALNYLFARVCYFNPP